MLDYLLKLRLFRRSSTGKRNTFGIVNFYFGIAHEHWTRTGVSSTDVGTSAHGVLVFYFFLEIAGAHVLLPILLAIFTFSTRATRHPTLINLCLTWILSGVSYIRFSIFPSGN